MIRVSSLLQPKEFAAFPHSARKGERFFLNDREKSIWNNDIVLQSKI